jgi:hypothetical protein
MTYGLYSGGASLETKREAIERLAYPGGAMTVNLTDDERQVLLRLIKDALASPRYPLSPEVETLRHIVEKIEGDEKRSGKPARSKG